MANPGTLALKLLGASLGLFLEKVFSFSGTRRIPHPQPRITPKVTIVKYIKKIFKDTDPLQFLTLTVLAAAIGFPVITFLSWITKDSWEAFFRIREIELNFSIALIFAVTIFIILIYLVLNSWISGRRKLTITSAEYGVEDNYTNITPELTALISDNKLSIRLSNGITGGFDPVPGVHKHAKIQYNFRKKTRNATVGEGDRIVLPSE